MKGDGLDNVFNVESVEDQTGILILYRQKKFFSDLYAFVKTALHLKEM